MNRHLIKNPTEHKIKLVWDAILALQSGQHAPLGDLIENRDSPGSLKDFIWTIFRSFASNRSILDQIDSKIDFLQRDEGMGDESTIDDFETFYHDFMDYDDYIKLGQRVKSLDDVLHRAQPYWGSTGASWYENF